jgi:hypothetical protein
VVPFVGLLKFVPNNLHGSNLPRTLVSRGITIKALPKRAGDPQSFDNVDDDVFAELRRKPLKPGNIFRITRLKHFAVELQAVAAFLRAVLIANKRSNGAPPLRAAARLRVGLITFTSPAKFNTRETKIEAPRLDTAQEPLDEFIGHLSEEAKKRIARWK